MRSRKSANWRIGVGEEKRPRGRPSSISELKHDFVPSAVMRWSVFTGAICRRESYTGTRCRWEWRDGFKPARRCKKVWEDGSHQRTAISIFRCRFRQCQQIQPNATSASVLLRRWRMLSVGCDEYTDQPKTERQTFFNEPHTRNPPLPSMMQHGTPRLDPLDRSIIPCPREF